MSNATSCKLQVSLSTSIHLKQLDITKLDHITGIWEERRSLLPCWAGQINMLHRCHISFYGVLSQHICAGVEAALACMVRTSSCSTASGSSKRTDLLLVHITYSPNGLQTRQAMCAPCLTMSCVAMSKQTWHREISR